MVLCDVQPWLGKWATDQTMTKGVTTHCGGGGIYTPVRRPGHRPLADIDRVKMARKPPIRSRAAKHPTPSTQENNNKRTSSPPRRKGKVSWPTQGLSHFPCLFPPRLLPCPCLALLSMNPLFPSPSPQEIKRRTSSQCSWKARWATAGHRVLYGMWDGQVPTCYTRPPEAPSIQV